MIVFLLIVLTVCSPSVSVADIFKSDVPDLVSALSDHPYEFQQKAVEPRAIKSVNMDVSLSSQIDQIIKGQNALEMKTLIDKVQSSPLMIYQYSSPAAADLLKFYSTLAQMRLNAQYADVRGMEQRTGGGLGLIQDASDMACIRKEVKRKGDLAGAIRSCRNNQAFAGLGASEGEPKNVYATVLYWAGARGDHRDAMVEILPKWTLYADRYRIEGPSKRIGDVLKRNRKEFRDQLKAILASYPHLDDKDLVEFSVPGHPFGAQSVRDMKMLEPSVLELASDKLVEEVSRIKTLDQYDRAIEWMRRAVFHPSIEEFYKDIFRQGIEFLEDEKISLEDKGRQLKGYGSVVGSITDLSEDERVRIIDGGRYGE